MNLLSEIQHLGCVYIQATWTHTHKYRTWGCTNVFICKAPLVKFSSLCHLVKFGKVNTELNSSRITAVLYIRFTLCCRMNSLDLYFLRPFYFLFLAWKSAKKLLNSSHFLTSISHISLLPLPPLLQLLSLFSTALFSSLILPPTLILFYSRHTV